MATYYNSPKPTMMKLWCFNQKEESVSTYNETGHTILLFYQNYEKLHEHLTKLHLVLGIAKTQSEK